MRELHRSLSSSSSFFFSFKRTNVCVEPVFDFAVDDNESENRAEAASNSKQR